jgi:diguanylate cyclase (GGDEF)-like protein
VERTAAAADRRAAMLDRQQAAADRRVAGLDELTGVLRRGAGEQALPREIDRSRRSGQPLTLALMDVDELKTINDQQGHAAGDRLLRDRAGRVLERVPWRGCGQAGRARARPDRRAAGCAR